MKIDSVRLTGFRNFEQATVNFAEKTLIIGSNDVGKTNLLYALRLLLDRSVPEGELEPKETDFHIGLDGTRADRLMIEIKLGDITQDSVISRLKGYVSDAGESFITYVAERNTLEYKITVGHKPDAMSELEGRFYLRHIHFKYVESCRNIEQYIQREKRYLLRISKQKRTLEQVAADAASEGSLQESLDEVSSGINGLSYVSGATKIINEELKNLSHHNAGYAVNLQSQGLNFSTFVERLSLGAMSGGRQVGLGGDGRNNQILVGLWKAKSELEHDPENEAIIYCIEEPEAHLHPHQQRKLVEYLVKVLGGQVLVSSHSPQIVSGFSPNSVVRLQEKHGSTVAASNGCSECIKSAWEDMGYRLSILPAEAFFADAVFLVEGPSEVLLYRALARQLGVDLDFHNVSILSVDGIDFRVHADILNAMEIPWVMRTDNDVFKVANARTQSWQYAGLNRARALAGQRPYPPSATISSPKNLQNEWQANSQALNPKGLYIAKVDLENDLAELCGEEMREAFSAQTVADAIAHLQDRKAIRMGEFLSKKAASLKALGRDAIAAPLHHVVRLSSERRARAITKKP